MEFSYVPPPPEIDDDFRLDFSSQQTLSSQRLAAFSRSSTVQIVLFYRAFSTNRRQTELVPAHASQRNVVQAIARGSQHPQASLNIDDDLWNDGSAQGFVQRVPETPSLGQSHSRVVDRTPSSAQCRLNFSCESFFVCGMYPCTHTLFKNQHYKNVFHYHLC